MTDTRPPAPTRIDLVRHGQTEDGARGRLCGWSDPALSPTGVAQAERAAACLPLSIAALYTSTSRRALETASPIAERLELRPVSDPRLREVNFGDFEGLTFDEAQRRDPSTYAAWMADPGHVRFPRGETWGELVERVHQALDAIVFAHPAQRVAIVAHAGVIRATLSLALDLTAEASFRIAIEHGSIAAFEHGGGGWRLLELGRGTS